MNAGWPRSLFTEKMIRRKGIVSLILLCVAFCPLKGQQPMDKNIPEDTAMKFASGITAAELEEHVNVLASPEYEGRETGTPGNQLAAEYIRSQFIHSGIAPVTSLNGYFQELEFTRVRWDEVSMTVNDVPFKHMFDYFSPPLQFPFDSFSVEEPEVLFLGYGIDAGEYSDYRGADARDRIILIYPGEPMDREGNYYITGDSLRSAWSNGIDLKLKAAKRHGVKAVLIIEPNLLREVSEQRRFLLRGRTVMGTGLEYDGIYSPFFKVSTTLTEQLLGKKSRKVIRARKKIERKGKSKSVSVPADIKISCLRERRTTPGVNVLGYIEGNDPELKSELVILTAHYDHLGMRGDQIYRGADDNASGTGALMEIAEAFSEANRSGTGPRRSVLCMLVTGEEKGLLGSRYYTESPVFPLESTVANINIDMIGRKDDLHDDYNYVYVIGSDRLSTELHEINERVNATYTNLELDYTYNAEDDPNQFYYRSDHYNFAKHGIPAIFFFSGVHEDYHKPTDTPDKLNFEKTATIARLAFHTAWDLANREDRIRVDR